MECLEPGGEKWWEKPESQVSQPGGTNPADNREWVRGRAGIDTREAVLRLPGYIIESMFRCIIAVEWPGQFG